MARRTRIRWNLKAFEAIRRLPKVDAALSEHVEGVLDDVGRAHYDGGVEPGKSRSRGYVVTKDLAGIIDQSKNASLQRALARRQEGSE